MAQSSSRSWKLERASVHRKNKARPHSNKYSKADSHKRPVPGTRQKTWVGGYDRADGTHVEGHFRSIAS